MTLIDKACFERGCACYDSRDKGECVEVAEKREWTDLTDDEVVYLKMLGRDLELVSMTALRRFARDIAQTLKEKNHGNQDHARPDRTG